MKNIYFGLIAFLIGGFAFGQTLTPGDIALIGVGVDDEEFLVVALADIPSGESVFFTDDEWNGTSFNTGEGFYEWVTPTITAGTVITITTASTTAGGTVSQRAGSFALGNNGDGVFLYQTSTNIYNSGTYTLLGFAGEDSGDAGTLTGSGLTLGTTAVYFGGDNGIYNDVRTSNNKTGHLANIYDDANWVTSGTSQTFDTTNFIVTGGGSNPTIGFDSATSTENETNTTFTSANIPITVSNYDGNQIDIDVEVTGGTAEPGDYVFTSPTSLSFTADGTQNITIDIEADADFDDETVELTIMETSSVTGLVISQATHTVTILDDDTPPLPNIVINEIMADPTGIDTNGDGTADFSEDEFVELVNNDITSVDITGYTLSDAAGLKHTFGSIVLPAGGSVVVFGGGIPTGISGVSETASTGNLQLNNSGDTVTLEDTSSNVIATYTYGSEGENDQSIGRSEDLFGGFVQHLSIDANPVAASPGLQNRAGVPFSTPTWKGFVDTDWSNGSNWSSGSAPGVSEDIVILSVSNIATIGSSVTVNSVTTNPGANLIVSSGGTLNASTVTLRSTSSSYTSLINDGTINATVSYNRYTDVVGTGAIGTGGNDLVSLPLFPSGGETFDTFLTRGTPNNASKLASQTVALITEYAFGPYNNDSPVPAYENYDSNSTDALEVAKGYRAATETGETLTFTGDVLQTNQTKQLTNPDLGGSQWNLIGNPFPSYVDAQAWLNTNGGILDPDAIAIYGYNSGTYSGSDETTGNFTIINGSSNTSLNIAPGQGFFVAAKTDILLGPEGSVIFAGNDGFPDDMRTTVGTDDFIEGRNSTNHHLKIKLNGATTETTSFYFNDNSTRGLDPGFDAATLDAFTSDHLLYSHLVEENTGRSMAINSLAVNDMLDVTIPLGVNSNQGQELTFSIDVSTLPDGIDVYLDDVAVNTSTLLNTNDYTVTPTTDLNGTGRFYLRIGDRSLSTPGASIERLKIYTNSADDTVVISGELPESSVAHIYDLQGRQVLQRGLNSTMQTQSIDVSQLSTGVYVVMVGNNQKQKSQKVILN